MATSDERKRTARDLARTADLMGAFERIVPGGRLSMPTDAAPAFIALGRQIGNLHNRLTLLECSLRVLLDEDFDPGDRPDALRLIKGGRSD